MDGLLYVRVNGMVLADRSPAALFADRVPGNMVFSGQCVQCKGLAIPGVSCRFWACICRWFAGKDCRDSPPPAVLLLSQTWGCSPVADGINRPLESPACNLLGRQKLVGGNIYCASHSNSAGKGNEGEWTTSSPPRTTGFRTHWRCTRQRLGRCHTPGWPPTSLPTFLRRMRAVRAAGGSSAVGGDSERDLTASSSSPPALASWVDPPSVDASGCAA